MEKVENIVIVGAGIAGLATALGLHRLGLSSTVLESADHLRSSGFALATWPNAWRALDTLGASANLREQHIRLQGLVVSSIATGGAATQMQVGTYDQREVRCVRRNLLVQALEKELPHGTIRFGAKVVSIEEDGDLKLLHLADGSIIKTKVLVGCDGVSSVVARWLGLKAPAFAGRSAVRGVAEFPEEGHGLKPEIIQYFGDGCRFGILPVDDRHIYWFFTWSPSETDKDAEESPINLKQLVLSKLGKLPSHAVEVVKRTEFASLLASKLRFRSPFEILWGQVYKGNVCLTGDAFHAMTPDLGQGGCSALEDGVVLARCLGLAFAGQPAGGEQWRIKKSIEKYVKERKWRCIELVTTAYVVGFVQQSGGTVVSFLRDNLLASMMAKRLLSIGEYDCGELSVSK